MFLLLQRRFLADDDEYVSCEICGARVKERNMDHHMRKVHSGEQEKGATH